MNYEKKGFSIWWRWDFFGTHVYKKMVQIFFLKLSILFAGSLHDHVWPILLQHWETKILTWKSLVKRASLRAIRISPSLEEQVLHVWKVMKSMTYKWWKPYFMSAQDDKETLQALCFWSRLKEPLVGKCILTEDLLMYIYFNRRFCFFETFNKRKLFC